MAHTKSVVEWIKFMANNFIQSAARYVDSHSFHIRLGGIPWGDSEIVGKLYTTELEDNLLDVYFKSDFWVFEIL